MPDPVVHQVQWKVDVGLIVGVIVVGAGLFWLARALKDSGSTTKNSIKNAALKAVLPGQ
jgi:hypothetical protein